MQWTRHLAAAIVLLLCLIWQPAAASAQLPIEIPAPTPTAHSNAGDSGPTVCEVLFGTNCVDGATALVGQVAGEVCRLAPTGSASSNAWVPSICGKPVEEIAEETLVVIDQIYGRACGLVFDGGLTSSNSTTIAAGEYRVCGKTPAELVAPIQQLICGSTDETQCVENIKQSACGNQSDPVACVQGLPGRVCSGPQGVACTAPWLAIGAVFLAGDIAVNTTCPIADPVTMSTIDWAPCGGEVGLVWSMQNPCATWLGCPVVNPSAPVHPEFDETLTPAERSAYMTGATTTTANSHPFALGDYAWGEALVATGGVLEDWSAASGTATLFAWPAVEKDDSAFKLLKVAETQLDENGRYSLSSPITPELLEIANGGGHVINFMLTIFTDRYSFSRDFSRTLGTIDGLPVFPDLTGSLPSDSTVVLAEGIPGVGVVEPASTPTSTASESSTLAPPTASAPSEPLTASDEGPVPPPGRVYSSWECENTGTTRDEGDAWARIGELHTGSNFQGLFGYSERKEKTKSTIFQIFASWKGWDVGFYSSGESHTVSSGGWDMNNGANPFPRNHSNKYDGLFRFKTYHQRCVRSYCEYPCTFQRFEYRDRYSRRPARIDYDAQPGGSASRWSKDECRNSKYVKQWPKRKPGSVVNFTRENGSSHGWQAGYAIGPLSGYTVNVETESLKQGFHLRPEDAPPYIVCGTDNDWPYATRVFAGN